MSVHYLETAFVASAGTAPRRVRLSPRQVEVLILLGEGLANKPIGRKLGISACTVKQHVQAILRAFGAANRLQAVIYAYRHGILRAAPEAAGKAAHAPALPPLISGA